MNILMKRDLRGISSEHILGVLFVFIAALIVSFAQVLFKIGSMPVVFLGLLMYAVSGLFFVNALRFGELSILYPLLSLSFVFIAIISHFYFGESISALKMLGIGVIFCGIVILTGGEKWLRK